MKRVVLSLVAVVMLFAVSAQAQVFKLSLWDDICIPNGDYTGGLELGIGSQTQAVDGVQLGIIYSQAGKLQGVQLGLVNNTDDGIGVQWGLANIAQDFTGAQVGFVNYAKETTGLQLGFVNYTETMKGLQLGFVNIIKDNKMFLPVFVIFNFCF